MVPLSLKVLVKFDLRSISKEKRANSAGLFGQWCLLALGVILCQPPVSVIDVIDTFTWGVNLPRPWFMPNGFLVLRQAPSTHPYTASLIKLSCKKKWNKQRAKWRLNNCLPMYWNFYNFIFRAIVLVLLCVQSRTSTNANERLQYLLNYNFKREEVKVLTLESGRSDQAVKHSRDLSRRLCQNSRKNTLV